MIDLQGFEEQLLIGLWMTLKVAAGGLFFGLIIGLLGASAKLSHHRFLNWLAATYTTVIRGLPELLVVLVIYFGTAATLTEMASWFGHEEYVELSPFAAGVIALSIAFGAYATEIFRGAIQAIPKGQLEAAVACGMAPAQIFFRITLPQAWRVAIPGLGNLFQVLLKDTALISVIGLEELLRKGQIAIASTREPFTFYFTIAIVYLLITLLVLIGQKYAEGWASKGLDRPTS